MKKRPTPQVAESSALDDIDFTKPGSLPQRTNTVTADVLAKLLAYERLTGMESVFGSSTTRLGAFVWSLQEKYGWAIERWDKAQGCNDGRVAEVREYWLNPEAVAAAMAGGAGEWCNRVRAARCKLRKQAPKALRDAQRLNLSRTARRYQAVHPNQFALFAGEV